jgi:hypothetical protein
VTLDIHGVVKNATDDDRVVLGELVEQKMARSSLASRRVQDPCAVMHGRRIP